MLWTCAIVTVWLGVYPAPALRLAQSATTTAAPELARR
jgi:hypothetical protein